MLKSLYYMAKSNLKMLVTQHNKSTNEKERNGPRISTGAAQVQRIIVGLVALILIMFMSCLGPDLGGPRR